MIEELLARARRRLIWIALLREVSFSGACFLGGVVVLLILGTQILDWRVPVVLALAALGMGSFRALRRIPQLEAVARTLDRRCGLRDALSTAVWCRGSGHALEAPQRRQAEVFARSVRLESAFPLVVPKSVYAVAGLACLAGSLLVLRYGVQRTLVLRAPIAQLRQDPLQLASKADEKAERAHKTAADPADPIHLDSDSLESSGHPGSPGKTPGISTAPHDSKPAAGAGAASKPGQSGAPEAANPESSAPPRGNGASSLMSKLRDAVSSLMSKNKPEQNQQPGGQQKAGGEQQKGNNPAQQPGAKPNSAEQQPGEQSDAADQDQPAPGTGMGKSSAENASPKPGSGMGHQDGKKELQDAAQLAAMGKISEIIGKRSAEVSGEMTLEPQSGPQQLRTGYTRSTARHGESGGDVIRDEVPVDLQTYVQRYFEQVRKQAAKAKPSATGSSAPKASSAAPSPGL